MTDGQKIKHAKCTLSLRRMKKNIKYKAESLLGIHLSDFCREELVYTLIHPSHEAVLLPILRRGTADLLKEELEESDTMCGPSDNCFLTCVFGVKLTYAFFNHFCLILSCQ